MYNWCVWSKDCAKCGLPLNTRNTGDIEQFIVCSALNFTSVMMKLLIKEIDKENIGLPDFAGAQSNRQLIVTSRTPAASEYIEERKTRKYYPTTWICRDLIPAVSLLMLLPITVHVMTLWFMNIHQWLVEAFIPVLRAHFEQLPSSPWEQASNRRESWPTRHC